MKTNTQDSLARIKEEVLKAAKDTLDKIVAQAQD